MDFDVEKWLEQAREGRAKLVADKRELLEARARIDEKIAQVDKDIEKIESVAGPAIGDSSKRVTGVQDLVRATVRDLATPDNAHPDRDASKLWDEDDLVTEILRRDPMMKPGSIKSALRTLVGKGEIERQGKRGSHTYRWASKDAEQPSVEDRIRNALANAGKDGVSKKDLTWKAGDEEVTNTILDTLVKEEKVERFPVGDGEYRYRVVSKEEDASNGENQKTLFGAADPPP